MRFSKCISFLIVLSLAFSACSTQKNPEATSQQNRDTDSVNDQKATPPPISKKTYAHFFPRHLETNTGEIEPKVILTNRARKISRSTIEAVKKKVKLYKVPSYSQPQFNVEKNVIKEEPGANREATVELIVKPQQLQRDSWYMVALPPDIENDAVKVFRQGSASFQRSNGEYGTQFYPNENPKVTVTEICNRGSGEVTLDVSFSEPVRTKTGSWSEVIAVQQSGIEEVIVMTEKKSKHVGKTGVLISVEGFDMSELLTIDIKPGMVSLDEGVPVPAQSFEFVPANVGVIQEAECMSKSHIKSM